MRERIGPWSRPPVGRNGWEAADARMELFDVYRFDGSPAALFFRREARDGSLVWVEEAGFQPGFFRDRRTGDRLRFVALDGGLPENGDGFERLRFIEADVIEL